MRITVPFVFVLLLSTHVAGEPAPVEPTGPEAMMETVRTLASREYGGRASGSAGYRKAAEYAAARFRKAGLEPIGDDGYFQKLTVEFNDLSGGCKLGIPREEGEVRPLELGTDYVCRGFSGSGTFTAPVVFAGYGLSFPDDGYDDYAGIDVAGKMVLVVRGKPDWSPDDDAWDQARLPRPLAATARRHGAVGMLLVSRGGGRAGGRPVASLLHGPGAHDPVFPQFHLAPEVAAGLMKGSGTTVEKLVKKIGEEKTPQSMALASSVAVDVDAVYHMKAPTENVVAVLRGADPELNDQYVLVGGHLDHVGAQSDAVWFPGAHDNGSGAATVLAVAERFARAEVKPKRSLIFALFASEEQGLFGATHMAQNLPVPAEQVTAMFNIDCVGRGEGINLGSGGAFPALHQLARSIDEKQGRRVVGETWYGGGADATPFFRQGIPTIYFHTPGGYDIIHSLRDAPDAIDAELLSDAARLVYATAREVAMGGYEREEPAPREAVAQ